MTPSPPPAGERDIVERLELLHIALHRRHDRTSFDVEAIQAGANEIRRLRSVETEEEVAALIEAAYQAGASDGLKHGPIVTKWCFTMARARAALAARRG